MFSGNAHDTTTRMAAGAAQIQSGDWRAISGTADEELVEAHRAVEDVAACQTDLIFDVLRRLNLKCFQMSDFKFQCFQMSNVEF